MKKLYFILSFFVSILIFSQVPQGFTYQAIAFNSSGQPVANGNVSVRISILDNSATGTVLYTETHAKTTNSKGLVNLNIGQGSPTTGTFSAINWATNPKFIKVEMDPTGGTSYTNIGVNQLMSVPYANVSKTVYTDAGQGLTLVSPNGTRYILNVDDAGNLSLPTAGSSQNYPSQFYLYGTFNSYDASQALLINNISDFGKLGFKYFTAGTKIKFLSSANSNAQIFGIDGGNNLILNGNEYSISTNGFYKISLSRFTTSDLFNLKVVSTIPKVYYNSSTINPTYNSVLNTFTFLLSGVTSTNKLFNIDFDNSNYGDDLNDGTLDQLNSSNYIQLPNTTSVAKNYQVDLVLNFDGTGNYTIKDLGTTITVPTTSYLVGTFNSWDANTALQMTQLSSGIFKINYNFATGNQVKILTQKNWNVNYGGSNQILTYNGQNIIAPTATSLTVNYNNMTYTFN